MYRHQRDGCDDEAVRRNEGSAPARVEADAGFLEMLNPLRRRLELMFFLELFSGGALKSHMPSSANAQVVIPITKRKSGQRNCRQNHLYMRES